MLFLSLVVCLCFLTSINGYAIKNANIKSFKAATRLFSTDAPIKSASDIEPSSMPPLQFTPPVEAPINLNNDAVFIFGKEQKPGKDYKSMKPLLGGKGANLAEMSEIGLSVPPGFTVTTEVCAAFHSAGKRLPTGVWNNIIEGLGSIERSMGRKFGDVNKPLLVSVRSGAAISMPGMMDTILNLGLNDQTVQGLSKEFGERFALDSYRRFLNMFGTVVMAIPHEAFEKELTALKNSVGAKEDSDLNEEQLKTLVQKYKSVYTDHGKVFTEHPLGQLTAAINAVFDSWQSDRAIKYREAEGITGLLGTAVNVQAMVFGNLGPTSGTGVLFTRNPNTGEKKLYGEYLLNAQGEDVVAGIRTPLEIAQLESQMPEAYADLVRNIEILEKQYGDMQDMEFTIQDGELFMLQTRSGKRVGQAAMKIAVDMVEEGLATTEQAVLMVNPEHLDQLLHPQFKDTSDEQYTSNVVAKGLPASPGAAVGKAYFSTEKVEAAKARGEKAILVRDETSPEDVGGMWAAQGVLTARGGMTSHAAVVARGWGTPCVCGCGAIEIDFEKGTMKIDGTDRVVKEGDVISLNGNTGEVILADVELTPPSIEQSPEAVTLMKWVDEIRQLNVIANADTPADAAEARRNGAQGIGLTRTEHMFFSEERIRVVRRMILAKDDERRNKALEELVPFQRKDFEGILEAMDGLPVTVRLLDPPLHEFLPAPKDITEDFAADLGLTVEECKHEVEKMEEVNPMLGLRGCRLGIVMPDLVRMQAVALIKAALNNKAKGLDPRPEIMVPLVGSAAEFSNQAKLIRDAIEEVFEERGVRVEYKLGTMIEVPRAAITASQLSLAGAEFFSYGTNDLTQMTYGFSRDDCASYLPEYMRQGIIETDPFQTIDEDGVGYLIDMSAKAGRELARKKHRFFKAGICGEHGGDPKSVRFFNAIGLDYVSCSPFRVPVARLAAAQAVVEQSRKRVLQRIR